MEKVIAVVALSLIACAEPAPRCPPAPPPPPAGPSAEELQAANKRADDLATKLAKAELDNQRYDGMQKVLVENIEMARKAGTNGMYEVMGGGSYYLIEYTGNDCGGLPRHIMRIEHSSEEWRWLGLRCQTKQGEKDDVGFECQGNNDKITARRTGWNTYEGVESRSPSTSPFNKGPLKSTCTGAWGVKATLITHVPKPTQ